LIADWRLASGSGHWRSAIGQLDIGNQFADDKAQQPLANRQSAIGKSEMTLWA
jgi:hypothetical protein